MSCAEGTGEDLAAFLKLCQPLSEIIKVFSVELAEISAEEKKKCKKNVFLEAGLF